MVGYRLIDKVTVCESPIEQKRDDRLLLCKKPKCKAAWQALDGFGRYAVSPAAGKASKTLDFIDSKRAPKPDRAPTWRVVAAGAPMTANSYHCATVGADEALVARDRINAAHWKPIKAGERGYRLLDKVTARVSVVASPSIVSELPDDLSIPACLSRPPEAVRP